MLTKKHRQKIRTIAADLWNGEFRHTLYGGPLTGLAIENASAIMKQHIRSRGSDIFGTGIIASIAMSFLMKLAIKYAIKLLHHWIENRMFSGVQPGGNPRGGEPTE